MLQYYENAAAMRIDGSCDSCVPYVVTCESLKCAGCRDGKMHLENFNFSSLEGEFSSTAGIRLISL